MQQQFSPTQLVPAIIVAERPEGITDADRQYLDGALERIGSINGVEQVSPQIPSPRDDQALQMIVSIDSGAEPEEAVSATRAVLEQPPAGLTVLVSGPAGQVADLSEAFSGVDGLLLLVAFGVLLDTLIVRSLLVPALSLDVGKKIWWPSRPGRRASH